MSVVCLWKFWDSLARRGINCTVGRKQFGYRLFILSKSIGRWVRTSQYIRMPITFVTATTARIEWGQSKQSSSHNGEVVVYVAQ